MLTPKDPQAAGDVAAVWREHAARSPGFKITHIGPDGKELN